MTPRLPSLRAALLALPLLLAGASAEAGDVIVFAAVPSPGETWQRGYGAAFNSTWFQVANFEGEAAKLPGEVEDSGMTTLTVSAQLAPPVGVFTPYGGLGVGVFRQTRGSLSDTGTLRALMFGIKVKLGGLLVIKGEYRKLTLSGLPLLPITYRVSLGAGISF